MTRRMPWTILLALSILTTLLAGCGGGSDAPAPVRQDISAAQLEAMMGDGQPLVILDVRTVGEFAAGHLPGSVNIPLSELAARVGELDEDGRIVVVCGSGIRSVQGAEVLLDAGCSDVYNLAGGLLTWEGELETG